MLSQTIKSTLFSLMFCWISHVSAGSITLYTNSNDCTDSCTDGYSVYVGASCAGGCISIAAGDILSVSPNPGEGGVECLYEFYTTPDCSNQGQAIRSDSATTCYTQSVNWQAFRVTCDIPQGNPWHCDVGGGHKLKRAEPQTLNISSLAGLHKRRCGPEPFQEHLWFYNPPEYFLFDDETLIVTGQITYEIFDASFTNEGSFNNDSPGLTAQQLAVELLLGEENNNGDYYFDTITTSTGLIVDASVLTLDGETVEAVTAEMGVGALSSLLTQAINRMDVTGNLSGSIYIQRIDNSGTTPIASITLSILQSGV